MNSEKLAEDASLFGERVKIALYHAALEIQNHLPSKYRAYRFDVEVRILCSTSVGERFGVALMDIKRVSPLFYGEGDTLLKAATMMIKEATHGDAFSEEDVFVSLHAGIG